MAPEQRIAEERQHLVSEAEHLLSRASQDVDSSALCSSWRGLSRGHIAAFGVLLLLCALASSLALLAHQAFNCSSSEAWPARLVCHQRSAVHGADPSHAVLLESENAESDKGKAADSANSAAPAYCNPARPSTESGWKSRAWDLEDGFKLACEARNRLKDHWKIRFSTADRNWCWVGVKDMCHGSMHRPQNWDAYREAAFQQSLAPSSLDSPFDPLENPALCDKASREPPAATAPEEEEQANKWFSKNVKVYVVSLSEKHDRSDLVFARLKALGIEATRLDGLNMNASGMLDKAQAEGWIPKAFNFTAAEKVANELRFKEGSVLGTLGHASAHFMAQNQIVKDGALLGLVLEDDSYLIDGFVINLWRILTTELPCDWDIVQLLARCPYGKCISKHLARIRPDGNEPDWRCRAGVNLGMHAMLYRTSSLPAVQELWQATTFNEKSPHCLDVDVALASISDRVGYYAVPNSQTPGLVKEMQLGSAPADVNPKTDQ